MKDNHQHTNLLSRFKNHVETNKLFTKKDRLFLACSGGIDSVVLASLLKKMGCDFTLLHCNFQLRGEESMRDQQFVQSLASTLDVKYLDIAFDTNALMVKWKKGVQETARILRYNWFKQIIDDSNSKGEHAYVMTAHHNDDQIETMAFHFFRGTGISGLQGIKAKEDYIIRPLLFASRNEIAFYAKENDLKWVEDSSNQESDYARNHFRNEVFPLIEKIIPSFRQNLYNNIKRFNEANLLYKTQIENIRKKTVEKRGNGFAIPINKLKSLVPLDSILYELFMPFGFQSTQLDEIKKLFTAHTGSSITSDQYRLLKNRNWFIIDPIDKKSSGIFVIEKDERKIFMGDQALEISEKAGSQISSDTNLAQLDASLIEFPLMLRPWKKGDYFYPLGMKKKKKVSRFLTDLKLSLIDKEEQYVVESNKKIIWVVGKRIDDRFKITPSTKSTLELKYH